MSIVAYSADMATLIAATPPRLFAKKTRIRHPDDSKTKPSPASPVLPVSFKEESINPHPYSYRRC